MMFCEMLDLAELLNDGKPYKEQLQRVNIITNDLGDILDKLEAAAEGKGKRGKYVGAKRLPVESGTAERAVPGQRDADHP